MRRTRLVTPSIACFLGAAAGLAGPAAGLPTATSPTADRATLRPAAEDFSAREVYAFAEAATQVKRITAAWTPKIEGAASEAEATRYKKAAVQQMQQVILGAGLTMTEYQSIARAAQSDPLLREEIQQLVEEME